MVFEGRTDVVTKFVGRKGDHDEFQLILLGRKTKRNRHGNDTIGYELDPSKRQSTPSCVCKMSFRNLPEGPERRWPLPAHFFLIDAYPLPQLRPQYAKDLAQMDQRLVKHQTNSALRGQPQNQFTSKQ